MKHYRTEYRFGPRHTPSLIKILLLSTIILSLFSVILNRFFPTFFTLKNPIAYLSLSIWGIKHFFLWQFITYIFIPPFGYGFSIAFFLYLAFSMYLLWMIGTSILELKGKKDFLKLYFGAAILIGIIVFFLSYLSHYPFPFSGAMPSIYALLAAWLILYPDVQFLLFLIMPIKAKWLVLGIAVLDIFSDISTGQYIHSTSTILALLFGYFFGVIKWERPGPFHALNEFDHHIIRLKRKFIRKSKGKIYDIRTGKAIDTDDAFMDRCLAKISKHGKNSLTLKERWRMRRISKRKRKRDSK